MYPDPVTGFVPGGGQAGVLIVLISKPGKLQLQLPRRYACPRIQVQCASVYPRWNGPAFTVEFLLNRYIQVNEVCNEEGGGRYRKTFQQ